MCLYFDIISLPIIYLMHGCSYYICIGRVFGYQRNGKDVPGRVSLGAASTKNPGLWQVTNMARSNREITLTAVRNRFERILSLWLWIMDLMFLNYLSLKQHITIRSYAACTDQSCSMLFCSSEVRQSRFLQF